jgi:hypothetical protein
MADHSKRGGQKKGNTQVNSEEHRGVRPGSTSQDKAREAGSTLCRQKPSWKGR